MSKLTFMALRRMRAPLLALVLVYSVSILGLTLIPGVDASGEIWYLDFFHAFYFVSFMATTIGFGEIPQEFSDAQRLWVLVSLHLTVVAWIYAIGAILSLVQDKAFRRVIEDSRFAHSIESLREPFFLVCGFGDTGRALVRALTDRNVPTVVVDSNAGHIEFLAIQNFQRFTPGLCSDVRHPWTLQRAGLTNLFCQGVVALTNDEPTNLKVAITVKLLNPKLPVICRAETQSIEDNMASFGTDHIVDPFKIFADRLALALEKPGAFLLHTWLSGVPDSKVPDPIFPPKGKWILCGYGRFGRAMRGRLASSGLEIVTVESDPQRAMAVRGAVLGQGTEAVTLLEAGIMDAVGLVAGTDVDVNNLSIVMTARELNPDLFVVIRQNKSTNWSLFEAIAGDLLMQPSEVIAQEARVLLTLPLIPEFFREVRQRDNDWANELASRITAVIGEYLPDIWSIAITREEAPALWRALSDGARIPLGLLRRFPRERERLMSALPLMRVRGRQVELTPAEESYLALGDRFLFCGRHGVGLDMLWACKNTLSLRYLLTGDESPDGHLWRWIHRRRGWRNGAG